jgi:hypothetical protein
MRSVEGVLKEYRIEGQKGENALLEGDVDIVGSHKGRDRKLTEDKGARVCTER